MTPGASRRRARRWAQRGFTFALILGVADGGLVVFDFAPDQLRLVLVMGLGFAVTLLLIDTLADDAPAWDDDPVRPMSVAGSDHRLAAYVRLVESHLTSTAADAGLRDRLALLADERLARGHALTRQDPEAEVLLGTDLLRDLNGPVRRLSRTEIAHHLERIERL